MQSGSDRYPQWQKGALISGEIYSSRITPRAACNACHAALNHSGIHTHNASWCAGLMYEINFRKIWPVIKGEEWSEDALAVGSSAPTWLLKPTSTNGLKGNGRGQLARERMIFSGWHRSWHKYSCERWYLSVARGRSLPVLHFSAL